MNEDKCDLREKTDLVAVKRIANAFLHLPIKQNEKIPFVVSHPFYSSMIGSIKVDGKDTMIDLSNENDLLTARSVVAKRIDEVKVYREFLVLLNKPYLSAFFLFTQKYLGSEDFSSFLGTLWTYVEFPNSDPNVSKQEFVRYFRRADKEKLMKPDEYKAYCGLPS